LKENKAYNVALIGFGYWGPNLARNIVDHPYFNLKFIAEKSKERQDVAKRSYSFVVFKSSPFELTETDTFDVVVIATPVEFHFEIAKWALELGKHVLLEKPGCGSVDQLYQLDLLAKQNECVLMIDYTFLFNGAVRKINQIIKEDTFGKINYIDSTRINLGIFHKDVNVLWDLASHDLAIIYFLTKKLPKTIKADGISHTKNGIENIAFLVLRYDEDDFIVHLNCSWTSPVKIRQMLIGGDKKMLIFNDIEPTDKIKVYDCNFNFSEMNQNEMLVDYRIGDINVPKFETKEALSVLTETFYDSISKKLTPVSSAEFALKIACILEAAQISIENQGIETSVNYTLD
jgi:predicted dehydrogenase